MGGCAYDTLSVSPVPSTPLLLWRPALHDSPQLEGYNVTLRERLSPLGVLPPSLTDKPLADFVDTSPLNVG